MPHPRRYLRGFVRAIADKRAHKRLCRTNAELGRRHVENRLTVIQAELDGAEAGYVFLAGDSHAELIGHPVLEDRRVVNGGIGGRSARHYATDLQRIAFPSRASLAFLTIGTNDIMCRHDPLSERAVAMFDASIESILARLCAHADRVVVLAVPPVGTCVDFPLEPRAAELYSWQMLCAAQRHGCGFVDPFTSVRSERFGQARSNALRDEVHLVDYGPIWNATLAGSRVSEDALLP